MDFNLCLVAHLFALFVAAEASKLHDASSWGLARYCHDSSLVSVSNIIEVDNEMMRDSEQSRRKLSDRGRYISYAALKMNGIPCRRHGRSYYNCSGPRKQANNPYTRGCSFITRCARRLSDD